MKKLLVLLAFLAWVAGVYAQEPIRATVTTRDAGTDLRSNTPLKAREFAFGTPVYNVTMSSDQQWTVLLRDRKPNKDIWTFKGKVLVYDPVTASSKWHRKFQYAGRSLMQSGNLMYEQSAKRLERIDVQTGAVLWKVKNRAFQLFPEENRILSYKTENDYTLMFALDAQTGQSLWHRNIPGKYGWEGMEPFTEDLIMIKSSGLHAVRLSDGDGWNAEGVTYDDKVNMGRVGLALLTGVAAGAMGYMAVPYGDSFTDLYMHIASNTLHHNDLMYFATKDKLGCYDMAGKVIWSKELERKQTSKSHLFREGNTIYMLNTGHAIRYGVPAKYGRPYVAAYDAETGTELFRKVWEDRSKFVHDYMVQGNELFLLYENRIEIHEFSRDGLTRRAVADVDEKYKLRTFVPDDLYMKSDAMVTKLSDDQNHYYAWSSDGVIQFNNEFQFVSKIDTKSLAKMYERFGQFRILGSKEGSVIVNPHNKVVATCELPNGSKLHGHRLYGYTESRNMLEIDLAGFGEEGED